MIHWMRAWLAPVALALAGCLTPPGTPAAPPPLILVSIDGFRADYLDRGLTPVLQGLAAGGARADGMRPSFPSVTFPNHYTLVTGLRPDRHGIVNNTMQDPAFPGATFTLSNREEALRPRWWNGAEPVWVTAERHGARTATMFWPGSEVAIRGVRPHDWAVFDQTLPSSARVDRLLSWFDRPPGARPRFATLYFDIVDTQGHTFGPDSAELNAALAEVDAALGRLTDGLRARGVRANLVVVSDHGMAALAPERTIHLDAIVAPASIEARWLTHYHVGVAPAAGRTAEVEAALLGRHGALECWRKDDIPARFRFGRNPRVPPIFCLPDVGWSIVSAARPLPYGPGKGAHGYDNADPAMAALFVAAGPDIAAGVRLPRFDNVDVYPLLMRLIHLPAAPNDGDPATLAPALRGAEATP